MKLFLKQLSLLGIIACSFLLGGCDKTKLYDIDKAPPAAHFVGGATRSYPVVVDPAPSFKLQIGTTDVASSDRVVTYVVSSPSGAVQGTQYTITGGGSVTIPANSALADITIQANYAEYASGRRDTLIFSLSKPSLDITQFQDTVRLIIAGPSGCDEGNPDLNLLLGAYDNTNELLGTGPYGPYTTTIASVTPTSPTTGTIVVENIWDNGWGPITFNLDWTDPVNRTAEPVQQDAIPGSDAGDLNATYAGQTVSVRPNGTSGPGTYAVCDETLQLNMQLGVTNVGWFNVLYQVNMAR